MVFNKSEVVYGNVKGKVNFKVVLGNCKVGSVVFLWFFVVFGSFWWSLIVFGGFQFLKVP